MRRLAGWRPAAALVLVSAAAVLPVAAWQDPAPSSRAVYVANVDSIIHPVSAEYMVRTMDEADSAGAALVIFTLSTPGGLVDSTRTIVSRMLASKTPVVVFVGPSGARAASAGFILTIAADVAAMAPGTHIGAAHPVDASGQEVDDTMKAKLESDVAAYVRTLAEGRHRNMTLANDAVVSSRSFTEHEALDASPALIDLIAPDVRDLLRQLNGRTIARFDGSTVTLDTSQAEVVELDMSLRQRVLSAIAHPNIAVILLSLGILGITIELWSPGAVLPGVVGAISLILAFFALQLLPVNYAGLLLLALGVLLLVLELKVTSYGLLTVGGVISLVLGAMMLIDAPEPELRLSLGFVVPVVLSVVAIAAFLTRLAVAVHRQGPVSGAAGLVGVVGEAVTPIEPDRPGQVKVKGEIWRARSVSSIDSGSQVVVIQIDGLTMTVRSV
jgi:membrane-bound serine protease (ClpP class)